VFSVSVDSAPSGRDFQGIGVYRPMSFCRCECTAREEYPPALLKHRLDEKLKIYGFTRKTTLLSSVFSCCYLCPYGVHRKPWDGLFLSM
jgi:hypothetical protein